MDWEYSPAPESSSIADIRDRYLPFIDGAFREGSGEDRDTINPGTGEGLSTVSTVTGADIDRAVKSARRAYEEVWSSMPGAERGKYLLRIARVIAERSRELAVVETLDNGKPIKETRDFDVPAAAEHFFYHAGWADKLQHLGLGPAPQPLDVAGQVIPWKLAAVSIRLRATEIRRCRARWRRPPQSPS
jgi:aldehyde dehydrogenase (NAD+)